MSRTEPQRSVTTVMFTDVVGSTEQAAAMGDHAWNLLLRRHHAVVRRAIARFHGREVNTAGDAFLATFAGPEAAIRAACAARAGLRPLGVRIRVGIHTGEVEVEDGAVAGIAVHIAARVMALGGADEVLVSSTVRDLTTGGGFGFEDRGVHPLRGVPGEWRLFAVASEPVRVPLRGWTERLRERWSPRFHGHAIAAGIFAAALLFGVTGLFIVVKDQGRTLSPPPVVASSAGLGLAVLPFGGDATAAEISPEGMMDLLTTNLDGVAGFRTIDSRTTLARWRERVRGPSPNLELMLDVAGRTGARYALVGQAVSVGSDVRLTADVYEVESGERLGRTAVDGSSAELIALVDRLTVQVLRVLLGDDRDPPRVSLAAVTTDTLEALTAFVEGEGRLRRSDFENAIAAYRRAVAADSSFALAWYRLGTATAWVEDAEGAAAYLERAARLSDRLPRREATFLRADLALERGTLDGVPLLREAVKRYPDTPAAWYLLGETYFHLGAQALVEPRASEQAFVRATRLDPEFAPYHLHLVELAFAADDSAGAAERGAAYGRLAPGSLDDRDNRRALAIAFGDSASRAAAISALDTVPAATVLLLARSYLRHPRFLPLAERLLASAVARDPDPHATAYLASVRLARGRVRDGLATLAGPDVSPGLRAASLYTLLQLGSRIDERVLERDLALRGSGDEGEVAIFHAGAHAADGGRWPEHETAAAALRERAQGRLAAGDSTAWRFGDAAARALDAYRIWRDGRADEAAPLLEAAQREATGYGDERALVNATIRLWLGELFRETGALRKAERYLRSRPAEHYQPSAPDEPLALLRLGRLYEELNEPAAASEAYESVASVWRDADPELRAVVQEAVRSAGRLGEGGGGVSDTTTGR
jgi:class 3 adenylate cyclase/tetratricopeptide (TPR) repeat protein